MGDDVEDQGTLIAGLMRRVNTDRPVAEIRRQIVDVIMEESLGWEEMVRLVDALERRSGRVIHLFDKGQ